MTKENRASIVKLITAFFITWFGIPVIIGAVPAVLLLVILAIVVLAFRVFDRTRDEIITIAIGLVLGVIVALLIPQLSSNAIAGELLIRAFLSLWFIYTI